MKKLILLPLILVLCSCASFQNIQTIIGPPEQVLAEVSALAAGARIYVPAGDVVQVHTFATALATATTLNATILSSLIPHTGHPKTDALITAGAAIVEIALSKYGTNDPTALSYAHAVGNGILTSF